MLKNKDNLFDNKDVENKDDSFSKKFDNFFERQNKKIEQTASKSTNILMSVFKTFYDFCYLVFWLIIAILPAVMLISLLLSLIGVFYLFVILLIPYWILCYAFEGDEFLYPFLHTITFGLFLKEDEKEITQ